MLYFAYCTLLDVNEMHKYCPTAEPTEVASLHGYKVSFAKYGPGAFEGGCNLQHSEDEQVLGLLYRMSDETLEELDSVAGVDRGNYGKIDVQVTDSSGGRLAAITYVIPEPLGSYAPSQAYTQPILDGARTLQLPLAYVSKLEEIIGATQAEGE